MAESTRGAGAPPYLLRRIQVQDRLWRFAIAALTVGFGLFGSVTIVLPDGAGDSEWRRVVIAVICLSAIPAAVLVARTPLGGATWPSGTRRRGSIAFVAYADLGLAGVVLCMQNPQTGLIGTGLFSVIGAYVAHFVSGRVAALHILFSTAVILVLGARLLAVGRDPITVALEVVVAIVVANAVVALLREYVVEVRHLLSTQLLESSLDPLTNVLNRRGYIFASERLLHRPTGDLLIAAIDVDEFKSINDRFGHAVGDDVLRNVARRLDAGTSRGAVVSRLGGDEFAVISAAWDRDATFLTEAVHRDPVRLPDGSAASLSIGLVRVSVADTLPKHGSTRELIDDLNDRADHALQSSKTEGRNRTTVHGDGEAP
ncbi:GGDEF domain-containing protein [Tsukamurella asaccharolytica]|uniref:GGDEF domain-containing protein n=1 Tax=Tsukamurella asaccharolytica TaxID=2592067 RepID=A0A5C5R626_9ACTN|nr:GGDEF domain-containing protein [Tsukamurella asaccharolytica]TWS17814.1 GGDEF domain-containing protein [Tsukamurella asaccharolytica]